MSSIHSKNVEIVVNFEINHFTWVLVAMYFRSNVDFIKSGIDSAPDCLRISLIESHARKTP